MKALLFFLLVAISLLPSCKKEEPRGSLLTPSLEGTYIATNGDTAYVTSLSETYTRVKWATWNNLFNTLTFDSVVVANDSSLIVNQLYYYTDAGSPVWTSVVGSGSFGTNSLSFHFVININRHIAFSGVKKF